MTKTLTLQKLLNGFLKAPKPKRAPDTHRKARETFKRIIAELGTTYEISRDGYIEVAPFEGFPQGFTTLHYDWTETHGRFEEALGNPAVLDEAGYFSA